MDDSSMDEDYSADSKSADGGAQTVSNDSSGSFDNPQGRRRLPGWLSDSKGVGKKGAATSKKRIEKDDDDNDEKHDKKKLGIVTKKTVKFANDSEEEDAQMQADNSVTHKKFPEKKPAVPTPTLTQKATSKPPPQHPQRPAAVAAPSKPAKPPCVYFDKCFRKDPKHFEKFSHPGDNDEPNNDNHSVAGGNNDSFDSGSSDAAASSSSMDISRASSWVASPGYSDSSSSSSASSSSASPPSSKRQQKQKPQTSSSMEEDDTNSNDWAALASAARPKKRKKHDDEDDEYKPSRYEDDDDDDDDDEDEEAASGEEGNEFSEEDNDGDERPRCSYWAKCYRKNPQHFAEVSHPIGSHPLEDAERARRKAAREKAAKDKEKQKKEKTDHPVKPPASQPTSSPIAIAKKPTAPPHRPSAPADALSVTPVPKPKPKASVAADSYSSSSSQGLPTLPSYFNGTEIYFHDSDGVSADILADYKRVIVAADGQISSKPSLTTTNVVCCKPVDIEKDEKYKEVMRQAENAIATPIHWLRECVARNKMAEEGRYQTQSGQPDFSGNYSGYMPGLTDKKALGMSMTSFLMSSR